MNRTVIASSSALTEAPSFKCIFSQTCVIAMSFMWPRQEYYIEAIWTLLLRDWEARSEDKEAKREARTTGLSLQVRRWSTMSSQVIYFPTDLLAQMFSSDFSNHHCHIRFALLIPPAPPRTLNDDLHTVLCHFSSPPPQRGKYLDFSVHT